MGRTCELMFDRLSSCRGNAPTSRGRRYLARPSTSRRLKWLPPFARPTSRGVPVPSYRMCSLNTLGYSASMKSKASLALWATAARPTIRSTRSPKVGSWRVCSPIPKRATASQRSSRGAGSSMPTVLREVERAESAGIVTSTRVGPTRVVKANPANPLHRPLREIVLARRALGDIDYDAFFPQANNHG